MDYHIQHDRNKVRIQQRSYPEVNYDLATLDQVIKATTNPFRLRALNAARNMLAPPVPVGRIGIGAALAKIGGLLKR